MTLHGWPLAIALLGAVGLGMVPSLWWRLDKLERLEDENRRLAQANQFLGWACIGQLSLIEQMEAGRDIGEQADEYLREQGAGP